MPESLPFNLVPKNAANDRLLIAICVAVIVHAILFCINFNAPEPKPQTKPIEITLVKTKTVKHPKKAQLLAEENHIGRGEKTNKPTPPKLKLPSEQPVEIKPIPVKTPSPTAAEKPANIQHTENRPVTQKIITNKIAEKKVTAIPQPKADPTPAAQPVTKISAADLQMQIAQLGKQIVNKAPAEEITHIKFLKDVSTHKYIAAQYISDWEHKVEQIGNLNYPEIARKKNINGRLTMDVGITEDGNVYSIRVTKSSGYPELDDAAKKIVRMSAPFPPLPRALLKELKVLVITRAWSFSDESGMSGE